MAQASVRLPYQTVNPWAFEAPIAPHLAASALGTRIDIAVVEESLARARSVADLVVVEGIGGWLVPLTETTTVADMVCELRLPVVLVIGMRLGCLSHALLTTESIAAHGVDLLGWIANELDPAMLALDQNVDALRQRIHAPMLGRLPYATGASPDDVARHIRLPT
jgi:dethiobiotin synthetase